MHITGLWTHFGYADEFDVPEYDTEKRAWLKVLNTLLAEGYTFDMIHAQNSASFIVSNIKYFPITHMLELVLHCMVHAHIVR